METTWITLIQTGVVKKMELLVFLPPSLGLKIYSRRGKPLLFFISPSPVLQKLYSTYQEDCDLFLHPVSTHRAQSHPRCSRLRTLGSDPSCPSLMIQWRFHVPRRFHVPSRFLGQAKNASVIAPSACRARVTVWYWHKNTHTDEWNTIDSVETNLYIYGQFIFDIGINSFQWEKGQSL